MVDTIESMGFKVEKTYNPCAKGYDFTIWKNGHGKTALFEYPADTSKAYCDKKQREFIEYIVGEWNDAHNRGIAAAQKVTDALYDTLGIKKAMMNTLVSEERVTDTCIGDACLKYLERELGNIPEKQIDFGGENNMPTEATTYIRHDIAGVALAATMREINDRVNRRKLPGIKNVHFSGPCTIVIWEDRTKTIVRCNEGDVLDREKGLAMAIAKKALGTNKSGSNYYDILKQWLLKEDEQDG